MNLAKAKRSTRAWLSGKPQLLQAVFRAVGKPYAEIAIFRAIVQPGDTVLDLGANTGQYTCLFCTLVGKHGSVHAFEPVPPTFAMLKENTAGYAKKYDLTLNDRAAGDKEGVIKMFVANGRFTEASMVKHSSGPNMTAYEVRVTTVDRYAKERTIHDVALIKCDVEGAELLVMKGARELLKSKNPPMLFLEAWEGWTKDFGYKPGELFEFLQNEGGYEIYHVYRDGMQRISAHEVLPADSFPNFLNFLCIVPTIHAERLDKLKKAGIDIISQ